MYENMVLAVDDDEAVLAYYRKLFAAPSDELDILAPKGPSAAAELECRTFSDPLLLIAEYTALRQSGECCPVCVFDMRMPGMNGLEAAQRLRALDPDIEVVICTAYADASIDDMRTGLDDRLYLFRKPFDAEEFLLLVRSIVRAWNSRKALARREEQYRLVSDAMADLVLMYETDGRCTFASASAELLLGRQPNDMVGQSIYEFVVPEDRELVLGSSQEVSGTSTVTRVAECRFRRHDGTVLWTEAAITPLSDADGTVTVLQMVARDVTERKVHEDHIRSQHESIGEFIDSAKAGTWEWHVQTGEAAFSESWAAMIGYTVAELQPVSVDTWLSHCHPEDLKAARAQLDRHFAHETEYYEVEIRMKHKSGDWIWVRARGRVIVWNADGTPDLIVGTHLDIGERKNAEHQLRESTKLLELETARAEGLAVRAQQASKAKAEFLANMNHELRTPLNGIVSMTSLLAETVLSPEQRQYLELVRVSSESLLNVVNDIFDYSTLTSGHLDLEIIDFDLRLAVEDAAEMIAFRAQEKGLEMSCFVDSDIPVQLRGDPGRLRQILMNIGYNAVKFTPQGSVRLTVAKLAEDEQHTKIAVRIEDTGIGVPMDKQQFLFMPFYQVDASLSRQYGGTGLGLSIARRLAEMMGGSIGMRSVEGRGSTFETIIAFEKQAAPALPTSLSRDALQGLRVLIVDGHPMSRLALRNLIERWDCVCEEAGDAESGLRRLQTMADEETPFAAVLVDLELPDFSGFEFGCRASGMRGCSATRLVLMASIGRRGDSEKARQMGFDGYLIKPLRHDILYDCLMLVLRRDARDEFSIVTRHSLAELRRDRICIVLYSSDDILCTSVASLLAKRGYRTTVTAGGDDIVQSIADGQCSLVLMTLAGSAEQRAAIMSGIRSAEKGVHVPVLALLENALLADKDACLSAGMDDWISSPDNVEEMVRKIELWMKRAAQ